MIKHMCTHIVLIHVYVHGAGKNFGYFNSIETGGGKAIEKFLDNHKDVVEMWGTDKSLNKLQQVALKQGMENRFQLIQGPPGEYVGRYFLPSCAL